MWMKSDLKWAFALRNDQLKAFERSSYLPGLQERSGTNQDQNRTTSSRANTDGYVKCTDPSSTPRQRRTRNCDSGNPHVRGPLHLGRAAPKLGPKEHSCTILGRVQQTIGKLKPANSNSWESVKREIESTVLPTLYSNKVYQQLKNGQLMSRSDYLASMQKHEKMRLKSQ